MLMKPNYDFFNDDILQFKIDNLEDECEFKGFLGQGSFGVVHKVKHKRTNRMMAMKIIDLRGLPPDQKNSSILELMILAKCKHQNIVEFIGFDYTEKKLCMLLELLDMSLEEYISENKLDMKQIRNLVKVTVEAISYLKENFEITHRDIKPSNILVDRKLTKIKLSDFGTVKFLSNFRNTTKVTVRGTLVFMAPEMRQAYDYQGVATIANPEKCDIFSLGLTILRMITADFFYDYQMQNRIEFNKNDLFLKQFLKQLQSSIPRDFFNLLIMMLSFNPDHRPTIKAIKETFDMKEKTGEIGLPKLSEARSSHEMKTENYLLVIEQLNEIINDRDAEITKLREEKESLKAQLTTKENSEKKSSITAQQSSVRKKNKIFDMEDEMTIRCSIDDKENERLSKEMVLWKEKCADITEEVKLLTNSLDGMKESLRIKTEECEKWMLRIKEQDKKINKLLDLEGLVIELKNKLENKSLECDNLKQKTINLEKSLSSSAPKGNDAMISLLTSEIEKLNSTFRQRLDEIGLMKARIDRYEQINQGFTEKFTSLSSDYETLEKILSNNQFLFDSKRSQSDFINLRKHILELIAHINQLSEKWQKTLATPYVNSGAGAAKPPLQNFNSGNNLLAASNDAPYSRGLSPMRLRASNMNIVVAPISPAQSQLVPGGGAKIIYYSK